MVITRLPLTLAAAGVVLLSAAPALTATTATLRTTSTRVEVSTAGHRTSEFTIARDPRHHDHLVAAAMDWDGPNGTVSCVSFVSRDGGSSWKAGQQVPQFVDPVQHVDPWVTIDDQGIASMSCIGQYAATSGIERRLQLSRSTDGGDHWSAATRIRTSLNNGTATKDSLFAAPDGSLYACFKETDLEVVRSVDGGATWLAPKVFTGMEATCNGFAGTPHGGVLINWQGSGGTVPAGSFGALKTTDGVFWSKAALAGSTGTVPNDPPFPQDAAPSIAASPTTGHVFIAAQTYQAAAGSTSVQSHALIHLARSVDGTAYTPLTLPTFPSKACADCNQVHPALTVDDSGRLVLEVTLSDDESQVREVWLAVSLDEGKSWLTPLELGDTDTSDSFIAASDLTPSPTALAMGLGASATGSPTDLASAGLGTTTETIWPYFHRDGGEYFGITTTSKGIVTGWDDHFGDGRAAIWSRLVSVVAAQSSAPPRAVPVTKPRTAPVVAGSPATASLPMTGMPVGVAAFAVLLLGGAAVLQRRRS